MRETSKKSKEMSLWDIGSVISLQELEGGRMRSSSRASSMPTIGGQVHVPASHTPSQEKCSETPTQETCGQPSSHSSSSVALQELLASKLKARLQGRGFDGCVLTWRESDIGSQPPICALRASAFHIKGKGSIGLLPTPPASEGRDWSRPEVLSKCDKGGRVARRICKLSSKARSHPDPVGLNHSFALAIMGYPTEWSDALERAMQSTQSSPQNSSALSSKPKKI